MLHWGVRDGKTDWALPSKAIWPQASEQAAEEALDTPFYSDGSPTCKVNYKSQDGSARSAFAEADKCVCAIGNLLLCKRHSFRVMLMHYPFRLLMSKVEIKSVGRWAELSAYVHRLKLLEILCSCSG